MTVPKTIRLPQAIYDEIIAHAREGSPEEVCGILSGRDAQARELVRGLNEADNPIMDYWVDGQTLLKQFEFEDRGEEMIAIYHSHPVDEAYPSATDARNAHYPDATYLICSLEDPERPVIRAYRLLPQEPAKRAYAMTPVRDNPHFLAYHRRDGQDDYYILMVIEQGGNERTWKVRIVEQQLIVT